MVCMNFPCAKFAMASILTLGSFVFGCLMVGIKGSTDTMTPFYCSLITSAVTFWVVPPNYKDPDSTEGYPGI